MTTNKLVIMTHANNTLVTKKTHGAEPDTR